MALRASKPNEVANCRSNGINGLGRDFNGAFHVSIAIRNEESHGCALRFDRVLDGFADVAVLK